MGKRITYLKKLFSLFFIAQIINLIFQFPAEAQLFQGKPRFTRQDTLRGMLNENRSWWDVAHYDLKIIPDIEKFSISGSNKITFRVVEKAGRLMQIDFQEPMQIDQILLDQKLAKFYADGNVWYIEIPKRKKNRLKLQSVHYLELFFHGVPKPALQPPWDGGIVWSKDKKNNPWIGTACQGLGASSWWPCKDHQSDKADSATMHITVPDTLMNISNGRLRAIVNNTDKTKTWIWHVSNPISTYNLTMNIGKYAHWQDTLHGKNGILSLDYYVLEDDLEKAKQQFKQTKPILHAFEYWFGAYPFYEDGYKLVHSSYLGMEHQSAIAYGNDFKNGYKGEDLSETGQGLKWDFILVHESGHEWFGNNITSKDVADMWIHEGFTNYAECLYMYEIFDKQSANEYIIGLRKRVQNDKPVIGPYNVNKEGSADMYYKASNMLHTIRQIIDNDSIFRNILITLNNQYRYKTISSREIEKIISNLAGINLEKTFDQYLRSTKIPVLEYKFEEERLLYRWSNCVEGFDMKIKLPVSKEAYQYVQPSIEWQSISIDKKDTKDIEGNIDPNFYVEYKKVK
jgi:aminopeptidase N